MIYRRIGTGLRITTLSLATAVLGIDGTAAARAAEAPSARKTVAPPRKAAPARAKTTVKVVSVPIPEACPANDTPAPSGLRAFVDPKTGELRAPTREEEAALTRAMARENLVRMQSAKEPEVGPDGSLSYELGEDGMVDLVARMGSDGKPVFSCASRSETPKALTGPLAAPKKGAAEEKE